MECMSCGAPADVFAPADCLDPGFHCAPLETFETGVWCTACGWFEGSEDVSGSGCVACGCPIDAHVAAKVVRA